MSSTYATYEDAEAALYAAAGVPETAVTDHRIELASMGVTVRVREIGDGHPLLFLHGGPNSGGTWAYLAARLPGFRCLLLDRPGTGLSDPLPEVPAAAVMQRLATTIATDTLDALEIDRAHVVASSLGGWMALRSAAAHPDRFERMVQMACPAFAPGFTLPMFMRLLLSPLGPLMGRLPYNERAGRAILRQIGQGHSLDHDIIPQTFHDWYGALMTLTPTNDNEGAMIANGGTFRGGFSPEIALTEDQLAAVATPTHFIWGEDDAFGGRDVAERMVGLMPNASLEMWGHAGHLPWLDDVDRAAEVVTKFLNA